MFFVLSFCGKRKNQRTEALEGQARERREQKPPETTTAVFLSARYTKPLPATKKTAVVVSGLLSRVILNTYYRLNSL